MHRTIYGVLVCAVMAVAVSAQNFRPIVTFNGTNGEDAFAPPIQASDGNLYGATVFGGGANAGTVYKISPDGVESVIYDFCSQSGCPDGQNPTWLTQAADGDFYGVGYTGGSGNVGTIFKITSSGAFTTLYNFCSKANCADGANPQTALLQTSDGSFYGTTSAGGTQNSGTVFKFTSSGELTTLYSFCSKTGCADGRFPFIGLTLASDGNFYGTTTEGGNHNAKSCPADGCGTVFRINPAGKLTTLYTFCAQAACADGAIPQGLLLQAKDGSLYGTTDGGGAHQAGTIYKIDQHGKFSQAYDFCPTGNCTDGIQPVAGLIQGSDGNFYGTANSGGLIYGTVYRLTPAGKFTLIHEFDGAAGGAFADASLLEATDGNLYSGTTEGGDLNCFSPAGCGVLYQIKGKAGDGISVVEGIRVSPVAATRPMTVLGSRK